MARRSSVLTNRGSREYFQVIEEKEYRIPAGETLELPRREAIKVRGYYPGKGVPASLTIEHRGDDSPEVHVCNKCSMIFDNSSDLIEHMNSHFEKTEEKKPTKVFSCLYCDKEFTRKVALIGHMKSHVNDSKETTNDTSTGTDDS